MKRAILSCGALAKELRHISTNWVGEGTLEFVPPLLHLYPAHLRAELTQRLSRLQTEYDQILVIYGRCLPDMDQFLARFNAERVRGEHCLEIAGGQRFWQIIRKCPGTYFLIPSWCLSFQKVTIKGLRLDENPKMKKVMFRNYTQIVYFDTLVHGDLDDRAQAVADYIGLPLQVERVGLDNIRRRLEEALDNRGKGRR